MALNNSNKNTSSIYSLREAVYQYFYVYQSPFMLIASFSPFGKAYQNTIKRFTVDILRCIPFVFDNPYATKSV